jgi:hypothetical protein
MLPPNMVVIPSSRGTGILSPRGNILFRVQSGANIMSQCGVWEMLQKRPLTYSHLIGCHTISKQTRPVRSSEHLVGSGAFELWPQWLQLQLSCSEFSHGRERERERERIGLCEEESICEKRSAFPTGVTAYMLRSLLKPRWGFLKIYRDLYMMSVLTCFTVPCQFAK